MSDTAELPEALEPGGLVPLDRPSTARPGRRRTALVIVPLLAGLVVAGGVGGRMFLTAGSDGDATAATAGATCWDGAVASSASGCTKPRGTAGLAWVFPSFDRDDLECVDELVAHPEYDRPAMWTCQQAIGDRPVEVTYSQVTGVPPALRYFDKRYGEEGRTTGPSVLGGSPVHLWPPTQVAGGRWEATLLLTDAPFAVTATAALRSDAARTLQRRVELRPPAERRGS